MSMTRSGIGKASIGVTCWRTILTNSTVSLLGVKRSSYQGPPKTTAPHYDLTAFERRRAITLGARACDRDEIVAVLRLVRIAGRYKSGGRN